ncbi:hypothetical protein VSR82_10470 [Burkholderia sp. JPY481]|uniref:hypothetical protein n=1 Tax=Paraburkholderia sp. JPY465 TaxID=3042285 RepID=UPI003177DF83
MPLPAPVTSATLPFPDCHIAHLLLYWVGTRAFAGNRSDRHRHARRFSLRTIQQRIGDRKPQQSFSALSSGTWPPTVARRRAQQWYRSRLRIARKIHSLPWTDEGVLEARFDE